MADAVHQALVDTANVPADDRFQVVQEVPADSLIWDAGYLGQARSPQVVFIEITLNAGRTVEVKKALYAALAEERFTRVEAQHRGTYLGLSSNPLS